VSGQATKQELAGGMEKRIWNGSKSLGLIKKSRAVMGGPGAASLDLQIAGMLIAVQSGGSDRGGLKGKEKSHWYRLVKRE